LRLNVALLRHPRAGSSTGGWLMRNSLQDTVVATVTY
jgi:hypothetical protein